MTSKERLLAALDRKIPDRLPATTHHIQPYFLKKYMKDCRNNLDFFRQMGLDPIHWVNAYQYSEEEMNNWREEVEEVENHQYRTWHTHYHTPKKTLTVTRQASEYTAWTVGRLIKEKKDIEILAEYKPAPKAGKDIVEQAVKEYPDCLIRSGDYGCWAELCVLYGTQELIMETYDDPLWVKEALGILQKKKLDYAESLAGCPLDLIETGGGDGSTTVISPAIFDEFVAPFDEPVIRAMKAKGQRVVYHTCGGMMPLLERLADMGPDALETFTPVAMGGDVDLAEAKKRIGDRVCMIGGFDQYNYFTGCTPEETRKYVRRCFEEAGEGGGFILSPSDHFFDADPKLIRAFAEEAAECKYD